MTSIMARYNATRSSIRTLQYVTTAATKHDLQMYGSKSNRFLSTTSRRDAENSRSYHDRSNIRINSSRLMEMIHYSCQWGKGQRWGEKDTETGMARLALDDDDKKARDWFLETTKKLGCKVTTDSMGNQFAVRSGGKEGHPTFAGSHLDTQPTGGRYDGILGVCAGIEMLATLKDHNIQTNYPVGVVNWTNEEGARFPASAISSAVWAESVPLDKAHNMKSVIPPDDTATMHSELERIGYLGDVECSWRSSPMAAHFELHIEQGPILEAENRKIGIVQGVQAYKWFTITVRGRESHTGATSFAHRADALLTSTKMILTSHKIATKHKALASTGILTLKPGSTNTVPGQVQFSLDIRSPQDEVVEIVEAECRKAFAAIAAGHDVDGINTSCTPSNLECSVEWQTDYISPATKFHQECIDCVTNAGRDLFSHDEISSNGNVGKWGKLMTSGAGHDSVNTSKVVPTTMIFAPCRDGISHNPVEYCSPEDCSNGAQVLAGAVLRFDGLRSS